MNVETAIAQRWSPRAYVPEPISDTFLREIFEAATAAHSCFNEQPWRYLFAKKNAGAPRETLERLLDEGNAFAKDAWILGLTIGKKTFTKTGAPNRHNGHDVGAASQLMSLKAHSMGLGMRFMAGYDLDKARTLLPPDFEPYAMFVIGQPEPGLVRPPRVRNPVASSFFENTFGNAF